MSKIRLEKATIADAERLTAIKKNTFDTEAEKWLPKHENIIDYNIQPPGYESIEMTYYMINELDYFKVLYDGSLVGGVIITMSGKSYGRIDRIFIDPAYQGRGIGSNVINLIEEEFSSVTKWDLETSSRQVNNHHFYEKMGYQKVFETEDEFCYVKVRKTPTLSSEKRTQNKDISQVEYENCNMEETTCYQVNLEGSTFSNSNLMKNHFSNCNLSHSKFQNINFTESLMADLNLSNSEFAFTTLSSVRFHDTTLEHGKNPMSFERCNLEGTTFIDCNLKNVKIEQSELSNMKINNIPVADLLATYERVNKIK